MTTMIGIALFDKVSALDALGPYSALADLLEARPISSARSSTPDSIAAADIRAQE